MDLYSRMRLPKIMELVSISQDFNGGFSWNGQLLCYWRRAVTANLR